MARLNEALVKSAKSELIGSARYLSATRGKTLTPAQARARKKANRAAHAVAAALKGKSDEVLRESTERLREAVVYFWAIHQFPDRGDHA